jgi:hypothetical protein
LSGMTIGVVHAAASPIPLKLNALRGMADLNIRVLLIRKGTCSPSIWKVFPGVTLSMKGDRPLTYPVQWYG